MYAIDIETDGLDWRVNNVVVIGVHHEEEGTGSFWWSDNGVQNFLYTAFHDSEGLIFHNASFDIPFLMKEYELDAPTVPVYDTYLGERLLTAGSDEECSLKAVLDRRYGVELDKSQQTTFTREKRLTKKQMDYLAADVHYLQELMNDQLDELEQLGIKDFAYDIEMSVLPVFAKMKVFGIRFSREHLSELTRKTEHDEKNIVERLQSTLSTYVYKQRLAKYDAMKEKLDNWLAELEAQEQDHAEDWEANISRIHRGIDPPYHWHELKQQINIEDETPNTKGVPKGKKAYIQHHLKEWRQKNSRPQKPKMDESLINLNSPSQLEFALKEYGFKLENTRSATLKAVLGQEENLERKKVLSDLVTYRKLTKLLTSFCYPLLEKMDDEGVTHSEFNQYGTDTGRPSSRNVNLLQLPKDSTFRSAVVPREGNALVFADYSQMELRLAAEFSADPALTHAFTEGLDLHKNTASLMYSVPYDDVTDTQRKIAKNINFMVLYGGGPTKLISMLAPDGIYMTMEEAKGAMDLWRKTYSVAAKYLEREGKNGVKYGYSRTKMGRYRFFETRNVSPSQLDPYTIGSIQRRAANHVIQGSNADVTKLACVIIDDFITPYGGMVLLPIYDEILIEVPKAHMKRAMRELHAAMKAAGEEVLERVPCVVECKAGYSWSEDAAVMKLSG